MMDGCLYDNQILALLLVTQRPLTKEELVQLVKGPRGDESGDIDQALQLVRQGTNSLIESGGGYTLERNFVDYFKTRPNYQDYVDDAELLSERRGITL